MQTKIPPGLIKTLLIALLFSISIRAHAQLTSNPLKFDTIPYSALDFIAPGRGAGTWYTYTNTYPIPNPAITQAPKENMTRYLWSKFQPSAAGKYDFSDFDKQINYCIDRKERFSFGIMPVCSSCIIGDAGGDGNLNVGGYGCGYPLYIHNAMQTEAVPDWKFDGGGTAQMLVPNWNSESFLSGFEQLLTALAQHIQSTSYNGVPYSSVIYHIDVRGYGNWGEFHTWPWRDMNKVPAGAKATDASLERIIKAHFTAFPNYPLILMVNTFTLQGDASSADQTTSAVAAYALKLKNNWGLAGVRSDHLGSELTDSWVPYETYLNTYSYNGFNIRDSIVNRWKSAPYIGEPEGDAADVNGPQHNKPNMYSLQWEIIKHNMSEFSNEMIIPGPQSDSTELYYLWASKSSGYRYQFKSGTIGTGIVAGGTLPVTLNWQNIGLAPIYLNYPVTFELRNKNTVIQSWTSTANLRTMLPGSYTVTDNFSLTGVPAGNDSLFLIARDPLGYGPTLPLANIGVRADGSYLISAVTISSAAGTGTGTGSTGGGTGSGPANTPPTAIIAAVSPLTPPANTVVLNGSKSTDQDPGSDPLLYKWVAVGPAPEKAVITGDATATPTVSGLDSAGTYNFQLTVTDDNGATGTAVVSVVVNAKVNTPPPIVIQPNVGIGYDGGQVFRIFVTRGYEKGNIVLRVTGPGVNDVNVIQTINPLGYDLWYDPKMKKKGTYVVTATFADKVVKTATAVKNR